MDRQFLQRVFIGILGGAFAGFFLGMNFALMTSDYVVPRSNFLTPILHEQVQTRFTQTVTLAFTVIFAVFGPFMVANESKVMLRPMVFGFVTTFATLVGMAYISAWFNEEQPFNMSKTSGSTSIDFVRDYGVPISIIFGPIFGVLFDQRYSHKSGVSQDCSR